MARVFNGAKQKQWRITLLHYTSQSILLVHFLRLREFLNRFYRLTAFTRTTTGKNYLEITIILPDFLVVSLLGEVFVVVDLVVGFVIGSSITFKIEMLLKQHKIVISLLRTDQF